MNFDRSLMALLCAAALGAAGCAAKSPKPPAAAGPAHAEKSTSGDRKALAITVYNDGFGLVREVRDVALGTGHVSLDYRDVSAHIEPETVHIRSLSNPGAFDVLEQNYRYDLLTPEKLLEKYVGKQVKVYRYNEETGREQEFDAKLLSVQGTTPVLELGGQVTYGFNGRIAFPKVPDNLIPKPTLVWLLASGAPRQRVEVTYLTQGLAWKADYVLVLNAADTSGDLTGWVTLTNNTGTSYENAKLKLVAGDVHRVMAEAQTEASYGGAEKSWHHASQFNEQSFFEYHLYTLERPTTVLDKEQKQVSLLSAHDVHVDEKLIFFGAEGYFRGRYGEVQSNQKIGVYLDVQNSQQNHMGIPLPKGTVRVYKKDKSGAEEFVGEDSIDHTPKDERLRVKMGEAFDVVGERKQTEWHTFGICESESAWQVEIRSHKDKPVIVEDYEPVGGDWTIVESSQPYNKKDAHTFTFDIHVPANSKTDVTYRVRVRWC
jgi:hypothetical protein